MLQKLLSLFVALLCFSTLFAQNEAKKGPEEKKPKSNAVLSHFALGGNFPAADLAKRFGVSGTVGAGTEFITRHNLILGLEGSFFFGSKVKEDPLDILRTPEGEIIGNDRAIATLRLQQRGMYLGGVIGKLVSFGDTREGLRLTIGGGWAQHRIRILDDARTVPEIAGDYRKGYDRLTGGPAIQQFIGWQKIGYGHALSFVAGFEFNQAFTQTRRAWDFSLMKKLEGNRVDLRFGVRLAFTLPFYTGDAQDVYY